MLTRIFTIGIMLLGTACAFETASPASEAVVSDDGEPISEDETQGDEDDTSSEDTHGSAGAGGSGDDDDTDKDTDADADTDTDGDTGTDGDSDDSGMDEEPVKPAPGEPCDPILAFNGVAPCEDPENPETLFTCAPARLMPNPNEVVWEFRCIDLKDTQANGYDLGDGCDDDQGSWWNESTPAGCFNSWCLSNGLSGSVEDEHVNWPADECLFEQDGTFVRGCCTSYCDTDNPCEAGWTCAPLSQQNINIETDLGVCVWKG